MDRKICWVTTSPLIVNFFLAPHLVYLRDRYDVTLVVNAREGVELKPLPGVEVVSVPIERSISPFRDARALGTLAMLFRKRRFDLVHSFSPKGGLIAMTAAALARVPLRLHTFTGQVWATRTGPMRLLLKSADRVVAALATHTLADSHSQLRFLDSQRIVKPGKCRVLASGSITGVDTDRFRADSARRAAVRRSLGIADDAVLLLFLGRVTRDKGVPELLQAFRELAAVSSHAHLLLVGPDEDGLLEPRTLANLTGRVHVRGYTHTPEHYVAAADVLCLPSHREGFGSVIIEAAAAGVPAVASRIYGVVDAVVEEETGLLHRPGDAADLSRQLARITEDRALRLGLAHKARERAVSEFSQACLTRELSGFYVKLFDA
jgi:glycosyltransferase involved in cell wall biosynthesis